MKGRKWLSVLLAVVFVLNAGLLLIRWTDRAEEKASRENALITAFSGDPDGYDREPKAQEPGAASPVGQSLWIPVPVETDETMRQLSRMNLSALRAVSDTVVGWIRIPDTGIDYPINRGEDNTYYLNHTWDGAANGYGSIFMECRNDGSFSEFNTILYGHNMLDGSMFASLHRYLDAEFWKTHPYVYIVTETGVYRYEVFAAYAAAVDSQTYALSFRQNKTRQEFLAMTAENSLIDTGIAPALTDRILTLSTCTGWGYENRVVVHARLAMIEVRQT